MVPIAEQGYVSLACFHNPEPAVWVLKLAAYSSSVNGHQAHRQTLPLALAILVAILTDTAPHSIFSGYIYEAVTLSYIISSMVNDSKGCCFLKLESYCPDMVWCVNNMLIKTNCNKQHICWSSSLMSAEFAWCIISYDTRLTGISSYHRAHSCVIDWGPFIHNKRLWRGLL